MKKMFLIAGVAALAVAAPAAAQGQGKGNGGDKRAQSSKVERGGGGKARAQQANRQQSRAANRQRAHSAGREKARTERRSQARAQAARSERQSERRASQARQARAERQREGRAERQRQARAEQQRQARNQRQAQRVRQARSDQARERAQAARRNSAENRREQQRVAERIRDRRQDLRQRQQTLAQLRDRNDYRYRDDRNRYASRGLPAAFVNGCPPGLAKQNELCLPPGQYRKLVGQRLPADYRGQRLPSGLRDYYRDTDDYYYRYGDGYLYRVGREEQLVRSVLPLIGAGLGIGMPFPYSSPSYHVPSSYQAFYPDTPSSYHRYSNGYVYEIDRNSGLIDDMIPLLDQGYGVGQMLPSSYSYYNLPDPYRSWYQDDDDYLYRYAPGAIYQVDRDTQLITAIVSLLTGSGNGLAVGQPLPAGYDMYNVPYAYRDRYYDTPDSWYRYSNGNIYQVDPTTRLIRAVVDAIV